MGIGASIQKGFKIVISSLPVVLITFLFGFAYNLVSLALQRPGETPAPNAPPSPPMMAAGLVFILVTVFVQAGSMAYVRDKIRQGNALFSSFLKYGAQFYLKILLLSLVIAAVIGAFAVLAAVSGGLLAKANRIAALVSIGAVSIAGFFALIFLFFAPYVAVSETKDIRGSLSESARFVRQNFWSILAIAAILIAIGFGVGMIAGMGVGLLQTSLGEGPTKIVFAFISSVINAFLGLLVTATFMSFYLGKSSSSSMGSSATAS